MNREIESIVPKGWVFQSADFSLMAACRPNAQGHVTFVRDEQGRKDWHALPEELKATTALYAYGRGVTLQAAFRDAASWAEGHNFCGFKVVVDPSMAPNEIRVCCGSCPGGCVVVAGKPGQARDV